MNAQLILIVSDMPEVQEATRAFLESLSYLTLTAAGPPEARHLLETFKPAAILLEVSPPDAACEFVQGLKSEAQTRDIPLVGLGPAPSLSGADRTLREACDAWLSRPFDAAALREAIADGAARASR